MSGSHYCPENPISQMGNLKSRAAMWLVQGHRASDKVGIGTQVCLAQRPVSFASARWLPVTLSALDGTGLDESPPAGLLSV